MERFFRESSRSIVVAIEELTKKWHFASQEKKQRVTLIGPDHRLHHLSMTNDGPYPLGHKRAFSPAAGPPLTRKVVGESVIDSMPR